MKAHSITQEETVSTENDKLAVRDAGTVAALPTPTFGGQQMAQALKAYRDLQQSLDVSMKDQLIELQGKQFRKKGYWRAVSVAFNLTVEMISEERFEAGFFEDGQPNFGYKVLYKATTAQGFTRDGDGACTAMEKAGKFKCPHPHARDAWKSLHWPPENCPDYDPAYRYRRLPENATEHNVRSHAHSRAYNRAISNCVGFGEVSAEEVDRDQLAEDRQIETVEGTVVGGGRAENHPSDRCPECKATGSHSPNCSKRQAKAEHAATQNELPGANNDPGQAANRTPPGAQRRAGSNQAGGGGVISEAQDKRYFAKAMAAGWESGDLKAALLEVWGFEKSRDITRGKYNDIVAWVEAGPPQ